MLRNFSISLVRATGRQKSCVNILSSRYQSTDYHSKCEGILVEPKKQVLWIKFDRPAKFNAFTKEMYVQMTETFTKVNPDKSIKAIVLTGEGDYYSSGNDLTNFTRAMKDPDGIRAGLTKSKEILEAFVGSLINLEKFLIAAVNGPAVGIPVTTLPLCDYVLASDKATFQTPFTALGQCPEACSSITFPQIMGRTRASEMLMLNMTWDANKARDYGLVSEVVSSNEFNMALDKLLYGKQGIVSACYPKALTVSKSLTRDPDTKSLLHKANKRECDEILECWMGEECTDAIQKFFARAKK